MPAYHVHSQPAVCILYSIVQVDTSVNSTLNTVRVVCSKKALQTCSGVGNSTLTSLGSREGEYSSSAWSERLYRMSNGRARMLLAGLFNALHHSSSIASVPLPSAALWTVQGTDNSTRRITTPMPCNGCNVTIIACCSHAHNS